MILQTDDIKRVITAFFKDKPVNKVWLFGSYARGDADEKSDVDIVVDIAKDAKVGMQYFTWHEDLTELINKKVDVVSKNGMNKRLQPYIERDMLLIYER